MKLRLIKTYLTGIHEETPSVAHKMLKNKKFSLQSVFNLIFHI